MRITLKSKGGMTGIQQYTEGTSTLSQAMENTLKDLLGKHAFTCATKRKGPDSMHLELNIVPAVGASFTVSFDENQATDEALDFIDELRGSFS